MGRSSRSRSPVAASSCTRSTTRPPRSTRLPCSRCSRRISRGYLLCSDIPKNSIIKWQEGKGKSVFLKPSGYTGTSDRLLEAGSNGLTLDPQGRLVACDHGDRRVYRLESDGTTKTTLADRYEGKRLNSPNDGVFKSNGDLYFTDPPYGRMLKGKPWVFPDRELDFCGIYRLSKDGKTLTLLSKEMTYPNGIALSPDEKTLYVAQSDPKQAIWKAFPVNEDGIEDITSDEAPEPTLQPIVRARDRPSALQQSWRQHCPNQDEVAMAGMVGKIDPLAGIGLTFVPAHGRPAEQFCDGSQQRDGQIH